NSTPGPDGIEGVILKNLNSVLCSPLSILFNRIFLTGELPDDWKCVHVRPIFKKGCSSDPNNYRPISLTSVVCKIFESVIKNQLLSYLNTYSLISTSQHGFLREHSTVTNLLEAVNDWTTSLDEKKTVKILYTDFAKAFDLVSIPKLIIKLTSFGITGNLLSCLKSFLIDCSH